MPRQVYSLLISYPPEQEIYAEHIKKYLAKSLNGVADKYIDFTNIIHARYTFGPAISGNLIIEHSHPLDPLTLRRYLIDSQRILTVKQLKIYQPQRR